MFNGLLDQLKKIEVKLEEEDKALLLLNSLSDSYETYVDTIMCGKDTITMEQAEATLVSFDARKKENAGEDTITIAYAPGRRFCPKKCVESKGDTNLANGEESTECFLTNNCDIFAVTEVQDPSSKEELVSDSGCVNHVCTREDCFDILQEGMTKLSLPDNSIVDVIRVWVVKIKTSNGVVHTLEKVAYVPKLRHNLISLSQLDSNGYGYKAYGRVLKVTKGNMVLMKGEARRRGGGPFLDSNKRH